MYLVWFGWEGGSGVCCIIALRNHWSLNVPAKTPLLEGRLALFDWCKHTDADRCVVPSVSTDLTQCLTVQEGCFRTYRTRLCWDSLMGKTEKVLLVEAALRLIPPADRASSLLLPHKHTHMHRPSHKHTLTAAGPRLTQKVWALIGSLHFSEVEKFPATPTCFELCVWCSTVWKITLHFRKIHSSRWLHVVSAEYTAFVCIKNCHDEVWEASSWEKLDWLDAESKTIFFNPFNFNKIPIPMHNSVHTKPMVFFFHNANMVCGDISKIPNCSHFFFMTKIYCF